MFQVNSHTLEIFHSLQNKQCLSFRKLKCYTVRQNIINLTGNVTKKLTQLSSIVIGISYI